MREALCEALDLLDDTSGGKAHDGQQEWQNAYARIHDAAGKPQRGPEPRPWEAGPLHVIEELVAARGRAREALPIYEFDIDDSGPGWWKVRMRAAGSDQAWHVVAQVEGERRAEIVRDALSKEANERV
jgi:hypothetical protein